jgi:DNA-binding beta-propeller fold protein YncE
MNATARLFAVFCVLQASMPLAATASQAPVAILSTTSLPEVSGGDFDHFAVDLPHSRLYVSAEEYGSIEVFGLDGKHLASERRVARSPHKIELTNDGRRLLIVDAGDASVKIVDSRTFEVLKTIPLEPQPDSGVTDRTSGIFYVGNGGVQSHEDSAYLTLISIADGTVLGGIDVPGAQVKAMVIDHATDRLFVNLRDKNEIAVVDLKTRTLKSTWTVPGPSRNSAMAFDPKANRLFVGSRAPGKLLVLDASDGSVKKTLDIVDISDDMHFDESHHRLYVTGAGGLDVVRQIDKDRYDIEQHVDTLGGKTSIYLPSLKRLYVVHTKGAQAREAGLQIFRVQ